jgi:hypothetical protein
MKLEGQLFAANLLLKELTIERHDDKDKWVKQLENCLIDLCHGLDVPIPLWLEKNSREFARYHQTLFFAEQFGEKIRFDRMQIRWID